MDAYHQVSFDSHVHAVEPLGDDKVTFRVLFFLNSDEFALESKLIAVLNFANIQARKMPEEIVKAHPEGAIVFVEVWFEDVDDVRSPES